MEKAKLIGNTIIMVHNDEYCDTRDIVNEIKNNEEVEKIL